MTRDEIEKGMIGTFERYETIFKHMDVTKIDFLEWLHSLATYEEVRKAGHFMHTRFMKSLDVVQQLWRYHSAEVWSTLFLVSEDSTDVKKIKGHLKDLRYLWNQRPKAKRRTSNLT